MSDLKEEDQCPNCRAWHGVSPLQHLSPGEPCAHDPVRPCVLCGHSVDRQEVMSKKSIILLN